MRQSNASTLYAMLSTQKKLMKKLSTILILTFATQLCFGQNDTTEWVSLQDGEHKNNYKRFGNRIRPFDGHCTDYRSLFKDVDIETFKVHVNTYYAKDKNNLYYHADMCCGCGDDFVDDAIWQCEFCSQSDEDLSMYCYCFEGPIIPNVNPNTFIVLNQGKDGNYGTDGVNVYYGKARIRNADIHNFQILNRFYAKDENAIFYFGSKMEKVDVGSFRVFNYEKGHFCEYCATDKHNFYRMGKKYTDVNPNEVRILDFGYIADDKNVYYGRQLMGRFDGKTFQIISTVSNSNGVYIKDKSGVYRGYDEYQNKIEGADVETFQYLSHGFSKDKNHVYRHGGIPYDVGADAETFQVLSCYFQKDKNHVYYWYGSHHRGKFIIENADPETFQLVGIEKTADNDFSSGAVAKDRNHVFLHLHIVEGADAETFELLEGNSNYRDKNHYYRNAGFVMQRKESK